MVGMLSLVADNPLSGQSHDLQRSSLSLSLHVTAILCPLMDISKCFLGYFYHFSVHILHFSTSILRALALLLFLFCYFGGWREELNPRQSSLPPAALLSEKSCGRGDSNLRRVKCGDPYHSAMLFGSAVRRPERAGRESLGSVVGRNS